MVIFNFQDFIINFGYLAVVILTILRSLGITTLLPIPQIVTVGTAVSFGLNPLLVGIVAGLAITAADTLAYYIGSHGHKRKKLKIPFNLGKVFKKGTFLWVFSASFIPLPLVFGLIVGSLHYDLGKFILASFLSRMGYSLLLSYGVFYGGDLIKMWINA